MASGSGWGKGHLHEAWTLVASRARTSRATWKSTKVS